MKIYFSASRSYREVYKDNYSSILKVLNKSGLRVEENERLKMVSGTFADMEDEKRKQIYQNMIKTIEKSDICVFEASYPSTLHIGHEITLAMEKNKPVIVLYTKDHEPVLFKGINNEKLFWIEYNDDNLEKVLENAIEESKKNMDVRFNFFVSPKILVYLDWVARNKKIPRSVFLRDLIEKEMRKEKSFKV